MLTADLVRARRKGGELFVTPLAEKEKPRARELAAAFLEVARASLGLRRDDLLEAWAAIPVAPRERRLADGFKKLIEDVAEFSAESKADPIEVRSDVFLAASSARRDGTFSRDTLLAAAADARSLTVGEVEQALYADLKGEQALQSIGALGAEELVLRYDRGQVQAVLLRAVRVRCDVTCREPAAYRQLFRELKFRRLLCRIQEHAAGGYHLEIDGPFSLFESVTKYGLELALVLPALEACDTLSLIAEVRWGKDRKALTFRYTHKHAHAHGRTDGRRSGADGPRLRDDVATLLDAFRALETPWQVKPSTDILDLPGIGVCVPDLVFTRGKQRVHFESLGFWSRDAVWKRVEMAESGLRTKVLFAVSSRLRVSEAVLDDNDGASLYVYKGVMSARAVERKLDELAPA